MLNENHSINKRPIPHELPHKFSTKGTYIITGSTLHKHHLYAHPERLSLLQDILFDKATKYSWTLKAWAIFSNHYHVIAFSDNDPKTLPKFINELHSVSALKINKIDKQPGRRVWYQYWDTCLTFTNSYLARMNYVIQNPVKHGLVKDAKDYQWCSAAWFEENANNEFRKKVYGFKIDTVNVIDDF